MEEQAKLEGSLTDGTAAGDDRVLIYAGDGRCYWKQDRCGYTSALYAGVFSREEAIALTGHCGPEKKVEFHPVPEDHIPTLKAERDTLRRQNAGLKGALERVLDAAKSYRSDILGCSSENPNPRNESWMDGLSYAPKWEGRDTSIEIGEKALALTPAALDGEATVKENLTVRENAALRAAIDKAIARLDYCAGLGTQADFDATFQVMCELRSALTPDAPDGAAGALEAIGMFDAALRR